MTLFSLSFGRICYSFSFLCCYRVNEIKMAWQKGHSRPWGRKGAQRVSDALRIRRVKCLKTISTKFAIHCQEHRLVLPPLEFTSCLWLCAAAAAAAAVAYFPSWLIFTSLWALKAFWAQNTICARRRRLGYCGLEKLSQLFIDCAGFLTPRIFVVPCVFVRRIRFYTLTEYYDGFFKTLLLLSLISNYKIVSYLCKNII